MSAKQAYRAKPWAALQFGYPMYWVVHADAPAARRAARNALADDCTAGGDITLGTFDRKTDTLELGEPVTFDSYRVPVESLDAFHVDAVLGRRANAATIPRTDFGCDFGWVRISDDTNSRANTDRRFSSESTPDLL